MKLLFGLNILAISLLTFVKPFSTTTQVSMPCGPGVLLRADGSIVIDSYTIYATPSMIQGPSGVVPGAANKIENKVGPTSIILGKTLVGETKVCFEDDNGSKCIPLKTIKTFPTLK